MKLGKEIARKDNLQLENRTIKCRLLNVSTVFKTRSNRSNVAKLTVFLSFSILAYFSPGGPKLYSLALRQKQQGDGNILKVVFANQSGSRQKLCGFLPLFGISLH